MVQHHTHTHTHAHTHTHTHTHTMQCKQIWRITMKHFPPPPLESFRDKNKFEMTDDHVSNEVTEKIFKRCEGKIICCSTAMLSLVSIVFHPFFLPSLLSFSFSFSLSLFFFLYFHRLLFVLSSYVSTSLCLPYFCTYLTLLPLYPSAYLPACLTASIHRSSPPVAWYSSPLFQNYCLHYLIPSSYYITLFTTPHCTALHFTTSLFMPLYCRLKSHTFEMFATMTMNGEYNSNNDSYEGIGKSCLIISYVTLSHLVFSSVILLCPFLFCLILCHLMISYLILSYDTLSCLVSYIIWFHTYLSYLLSSFVVIYCKTSLSLLFSSLLFSCHLLSYFEYSSFLCSYLFRNFLSLLPPLLMQTLSLPFTSISILFYLTTLPLLFLIFFPTSLPSHSLLPPLGPSVMPVMLSSVHPIIVLECSAIRAYVQQKKEMLHLAVFSGYSVIIKVRYCTTYCCCC